MKEVIYFSHGNGFPSGCYQQLLAPLQHEFDCRYVEKIGHSLNFPVTDNWQYLVEELAENIRTHADKPVIGVGHSLGGVLHFMAAVAYPELFKAIILLDAPVLGWVKSNLLRLSKACGIVDKITPAAQSRYRRTHWRNKGDVEHYLRHRALFKHFTEACLNDFITYGLIERKGQYTLRFDPTVEYAIYRTIPHNLYQYEGKLMIPGALIYGDRSHVIRSFDVRYMKKKCNFLTYKMSGSHMFPMEHPVEAAALIKQAIKTMLK